MLYYRAFRIYTNCFSEAIGDKMSAEIMAKSVCILKAYGKASYLFTSFIKNKRNIFFCKKLAAVNPAIPAPIMAMGLFVSMCILYF
jgi:hypothetical protein